MLNNLFRIDDVLLGFRHLYRWANLYRFSAGPFNHRVTFDFHLLRSQPTTARPQIGLMAHHALSEEGIKRLTRAFGEMPGSGHSTAEESGVQQVQDRVFDTSDVLIHVHPV